MRRSKRLAPDLRPLTPAIPESTESTAPYANRSHEQLVALVHHLNNQLKAERVRNGKALKILVQHLDELQSSLDSVRGLYFEQISSKLLPRERS